MVRDRVSVMVNDRVSRPSGELKVLLIGLSRHLAIWPCARPALQ